MLRLSTALLLLVLTAPLQAVVFISEYVEGSSLNKAIELYNTDSAAFDLGAANCELRGYQNGSVSVGWTVPLSGSVPAGGTYVIANSGALLPITPDATGSVDFNGDDAVEFFCDGASVDVIGQIGVDPGSEWGTGDTSTQNNTIRRLPDVCTPDANGADAFDPALEWTGFPIDTFDDLGSHTNNCGGSLVFISEYVEGSAVNKAIELYNEGPAAFDLAAASCELRGYQNGSLSVGWTVPLSGTIAVGDVHVVADTGAILPITPDTLGTLSFNGDDAVEFFCDGAPVDIIGQIGVDPGSEWGTGDTSTQNNTLRRKTGVCTPDSNGADAFDPAVEWDGFPNDTFDGLGSHTATCGADTTPPTILSVTPSTLGPTPATSIAFSVLFSEDVSDFVDLSDVTVNTSGTTTTGVVFTPNSASSYTVTVEGIGGAGTLSLTVNAAAVVDGAGNPNADTLTSADVTIDPGAGSGQPIGLLLSEIVVSPGTAEFVEIINTSADSIDLSDVYLTDATFSNGSVYYYQIVQGAGGGGGFGDFHARFPAGASIAAGERQTVALAGSTAFETAYGLSPTYELYEDGAADGIPDMREAFVGSINGQGDLSDGFNNGEVLVLYYWDGQTDLVADLDYALWGDKVEAVDKTGVSIDGPDGDAVASSYLPDTAIAQQAVIDLNAHADGASWQRVDLSEGSEVASGGNGIEGDDESSEPFRLTWGAGAPTPGTAPGGDVNPPGPSVLINEINAVDAASEEFLELFDGGVGQTNLSGLALVFYDASLQSYAAIDLDGLSTSAGGYFVAGGANTTPDVALPVALDDGAAAVALVIGDASDYPNGTPLATTAVIDAVVYDSGQADVAGLLALLEPGEPQVDEDADGTASAVSLQRCPNGSGGPRRTSTYAIVQPTPGLANNGCPIGDYYANVDPSSAASLRLTLHETIDDHLWYPYSAGTTDTWDILELADEDPNDPSRILALYENETYPKQGGGNSFYNREHTWPRSIGLGDTGTPLNNAATDAHNLRLSNINYNSDRGNKPFASCDPSQNADCTERVTVFNDGVGGMGGGYPGDSNWFTISTDGNQGSWETWEDRRGDVARTMFYMAIRYEGGSHGSTGFVEPDLELTNDRNQIQNTAGGLAYMGLLDVLKVWHAQDPVDQKEMDRNEIVFLFQGNRNPFVDHPEWVDCIWGDICPVASDAIFADRFEGPLD
ncbi:lamin tail domain-containing protein [Wenzhouxiangella marina]|uniref:Endonuclease/exonuclease/phosphatase n=1 Tax=Wenzhouxiangella marina TaxID=1579979 RepID=A0A0K0XZ72_9GAMM|nr:endonuclease [Wenzhouxiangella marina]AKS42984.1 Endonuclease/exonuclease/phosphatase [Wenzhouxiangella marina]MBB6087333.1 endonuclease I [Wenzhouxiangella marina]